MSKELQPFTREIVSKHNKAGDLWIIIDSRVYDLSKFAKLHPGGLSVLLEEEVAGQDATEVFFSLHRHEVLLRPVYTRLQIGFITGESEIIKAPVPGELSDVPYAEPTWLTPGFSSPYYTENHRALQKAVRKLVDETIFPEAQLREADGKRFSQDVLDKLATVNYHAMRLGPGPHLKGLSLMNGLVKPEEFDYFHELIVTQETVRMGARGSGDGLLAGMVIGLPPILNFGSEALKAKIVPEVFQAKKFICLAISEAFAGSDVTNLKCYAKKTEDEKFWVVNGTKKWITNGTFADYFVVACQTDEGLTVLLIERGPGVETTPIKTSYSPTAGTAFITFDNVQVPVENNLGPEGGGIFVVLSNFNHERWLMCCSIARGQRLIVEECLKWASQRKVFGKPLISQAVIRHKLASMIARCEAVQAWLENVTYQMTKMSYKEQSQKLVGQIAFLKMYGTRASQLTAADAVQIFGGRGITQTGMGRHIEHYHRVVTFDSILGGAEDVMGDLGVRQAMRKMPKTARL